jgi:PAS domain S-box-containing protein
MKRTNLPIGHNLLILVCLAFFPLMLVAVIAIVLLSQAETQLLHEAEAKAIVQTINAVGRNFYDAAENLVNYAFIQSPSAKDRYEENTQEIVRQLRELEELVYDNPKQLQNVRDMEKVANDGLATLDQFCTVIEQPEKGLFIGQGAAMRHNLTAKLSLLSVKSRKIVEEEDRTEREAVGNSSRSRSTLINFLYASMSVNFMLAVALALWFSKGITARLAILVDNARRLARREDLHRQLDGGDEIGYLDETFHKMAETLAELTRKERSMVEHASDVICSISEQGRFSAVNPASFSVWGYQPKQLVGKKFVDIIFHDDVPRVTRAFQELVGGKTLKEFEARVLRQDGTIIDTNWSTTWSAQEQSLFCVAHDVTARKEVERLKQEFVAMVSHDLRTPLTSIQFAINIALEGMKGTVPEDALEELKTAERIGDNLIGMINGLLDLEKIDAGKLQLNLSEMKVSNLVKRSVDHVQAIATANGIKIETPAEDIRIVADIDRLLQVLVNLLSNAVKFSPNGSTIKVSFAALENSVEIRVTDQGKGIPADFKDAVFDRFQQVKATQFRFKGTGLGLAIAKAIVEAHGGKIGFDSEDGQGCSFWFRIPCAPAGATNPSAGESEMAEKKTEAQTSENDGETSHRISTPEAQAAPPSPKNVEEIVG